MRNQFQANARWFVTVTWMIGLTNDGWSGRPSPLIHQLLLLPFTLVFSYGLARLLRPALNGQAATSIKLRSFLFALVMLCAVSEACSIAGFVYEGRHFAQFGYFLPHSAPVLLAGLFLVGALCIAVRSSAAVALAGVLLSYVGGVALAMACFPLNYLRSDMLPVIMWADGRLAAHLNPYTTMHVGSRLYDFPYLPGMLLAYLPAILVHADVRSVNVLCDVGLGVITYVAARSVERRAAALLTGVFLLSPFVQYRHDLYLAPHWLTLVIAIALMRWRHYGWAALIFGVSMAIYQLSWVIFPFLVLNAHRRRGWGEAVKIASASVVGMSVVVGPFLALASRRIASNTVGQWSKLPHALADPINLSYWVTFVVRPDHLQWVQLVVLTVLFAFCVARKRCCSLADTLRWMSAALAIFIALNVLVDGYFYLTLLLLLLLYTLVETGVWPDPVEMEMPSLFVQGDQQPI